ncbi:YbhB/YbcL family Raf kinase inhibitor-like protein [Streptomyces sp. NPDC101191]|uniref:YbhB/YbcL family Raf kinase inhibitor-like protein n=1 Tax=Streptomyces sp. NPDC101191 TaxID=3366126 RepID=UPI003809D594
MSRIALTSGAFDDHTVIPVKYSGEGENVSPPLTWSGVPDDATELVLLCEDPDAPGATFVHWLVTGIDPGTGGVMEGQKPQGGLPWPNGFGRVGWAGPMPPPGHGPHRYFFRLYALSAPLPLHGNPGAEDVHAALKGRELASGVLVGTYER